MLDFLHLPRRILSPPFSSLLCAPGHTTSTPAPSSPQEGQGGMCQLWAVDGRQERTVCASPAPSEPGPQSTVVDSGSAPLQKAAATPRQSRLTAPAPAISLFFFWNPLPPLPPLSLSAGWWQLSGITSSKGVHYPWLASYAPAHTFVNGPSLRPPELPWSCHLFCQDPDHYTYIAHGILVFFFNLGALDVEGT